jgi:uncharacterized protein (DUF2062 family)
MSAWIQKYWLKTRAVVVGELRANASPLRASLSLAFGILVGFSPFYGMHVIIALPLAFLLRLNRPLVLLGVSTTVLPVVPFWIAAGIFTGKIVIPIETAGRLVESSRSALPALDSLMGHAVAFCRLVFPDRLFDRILLESGHGLMAGFAQWAIGCCVLALMSAVVTFFITYPVFLRASAAWNKRQSR